MRDKKRVALICCASLAFIPVPIPVVITHSEIHLSSNSHLFYLENVFFFSSFLFRSSLAEIRNGIIVRLAGRSVPGGLFEHSEIWQM